MKSILYLSILIATAVGLGIVFFTYFRPIIVEQGCAEIAQQSSDYLGNEERVNPRFTFDNVKERCLQDALQ